MQGKSLIIILAIVLGIVCVSNLSNNWYTHKIENQAKELSAGDPIKEKEILDSLSQDTLNLFVKKYNYKDAKKKELGLGLDLLGGMNVVLQVSVKDLLISMADGSNDPFFREILASTDSLQKNSSNAYIDDFFSEYNRLKKVKGLTIKLASSQLFGNQKNADKFDFSSSDVDVEGKIRDEIEAKIAVSNKIIRQRIDRFGVSSPNVQRIEGSGRILVELPGVKDTERVRSLLVSTAQLEFWEVLQPTGDIQNYFSRLLDYNPSDSLSGQNPLAKAGGVAYGSYNFAIEDTAIINKALADPTKYSIRPEYLKRAKFYWASKSIVANSDQKYLGLYILKGKPNGQALMAGDIVESSSAEYDTQGFTSQAQVILNMKGAASNDWANITGKFSQTKTPIAIVLDQLVYSAPVPNGRLEGGRSSISGDFTFQEATDLSNILAAGSLPASADIVQSDVVGPTLGKESINAGFISFVVALGIVLLWMIFYYSRGGAYSDIALLLNLLFLFGILAAPFFSAVLTLPGIAGIVLTIGMAVDANVIIFERIKEELAIGKPLSQAVKDGYANAMSSILDANITTFVTAIILFNFGEGPVKGFATTLMIGIATSLFCAILLTRIFIEARLKRKKEVKFYTSITKNWMRSIKIDFLGKRKLAYIFSSVLILVSLLSIFTKGLDLGIEFVGGRTYTIRFDKEVNASEISDLIKIKLDNPQVKTFGSSNQVKISTKYRIQDTGAEVEKEITSLLFQGLKTLLPTDLTYEDFSDPAVESTAGILSSSKVGPSIADDIKRKSFFAILLALVVVFLYILFRFVRWQFSLGAVAAVFHDAIITLGIFSIFSKILPFSMEIDQAFIAAILTVIGYSLNDTVIVFDRIRENINKIKSKNLFDIVNLAANSTLSRTINTSLTTLFVILVIFLFGGETIRGFMFALLIGVVVGTYSSLFVATPLMHDLSKKSDSKKS